MPYLSPGVTEAGLTRPQELLRRLDVLPAADRAARAVREEELPRQEGRGDHHRHAELRRRRRRHGTRRSSRKASPTTRRCATRRATTAGSPPTPGTCRATASQVLFFLSRTGRLHPVRAAGRHAELPAAVRRRRHQQGAQRRARCRLPRRRQRASSSRRSPGSTGPARTCPSSSPPDSSSACRPMTSPSPCGAWPQCSTRCSSGTSRCTRAPTSRARTSSRCSQPRPAWPRSVFPQLSYTPADHFGAKPGARAAGRLRQGRAHDPRHLRLRILGATMPSSPWSRSWCSASSGAPSSGSSASGWRWSTRPRGSSTSPKASSARCPPSPRFLVMIGLQVGGRQVRPTAACSCPAILLAIARGRAARRGPLRRRDPPSRQGLTGHLAGGDGRRGPAAHDHRDQRLRGPRPALPAARQRRVHA